MSFWTVVAALADELHDSKVSSGSQSGRLAAEWRGLVMQPTKPGAFLLYCSANGTGTSFFSAITLLFFQGCVEGSSGGEKILSCYFIILITSAIYLLHIPWASRVSDAIPFALSPLSEATRPDALPRAIGTNRAWRRS
jgi:hypothetical protein